MGNASDNRFYREAPAVPHAGSAGSYRDEFNTTADYDNGYRAAVRLARVLMEKHFPEATGWSPAPDLLGVITQLDHITAHLFGCFAGPVPEPSVSMPPAADDGAPCTLADRVGTSATFVPACTCHPDDRGTSECPRKYTASNCHVARHPVRDRFANDDAAKALYNTWADRPGWVPWVERGNSIMQERARREAEDACLPEGQV